MPLSLYEDNELIIIDSVLDLFSSIKSEGVSLSFYSKFLAFEVLEISSFSHKWSNFISNAKEGWLLDMYFKNFRIDMSSL